MFKRKTRAFLAPHARNPLPPPPRNASLWWRQMKGWARGDPAAWAELLCKAEVKDLESGPSKLLTPSSIHPRSSGSQAPLFDGQKRFKPKVKSKAKMEPRPKINGKKCFLFDPGSYLPSPPPHIFPGMPGPGRGTRAAGGAQRTRWRGSPRGRAGGPPPEAWRNGFVGGTKRDGTSHEHRCPFWSEIDGCPWWMIKPGKPGIAIYFSTKTTKKDTHSHECRDSWVQERPTLPLSLPLSLSCKPQVFAWQRAWPMPAAFLPAFFRRWKKSGCVKFRGTPQHKHRAWSPFKPSKGTELELRSLSFNITALF